MADAIDRYARSAVVFRIKKWHLGLGVGMLLATCGGLYILGSSQVTQDNTPEARQSLVVSDGKPKKVLSRGVLELTARYIRESKPAPPESARQYAYIASAYADAIDQGLTQKDALVAVQELLKIFNPGADVAADINKVAAEYVVSPQSPQESTKPEVAAIIKSYTARMGIDRHDLEWDGKIPQGSGKWVSTAGIAPFAPRAGEWKRWVLSGVPVVDAPPEVGSLELERELNIVRLATQNRSAQDVDDINFWGGVPGSDTPAGIWQKQLYETVKAELPNSSMEADKLYAGLQKQLAITIADAFMECWRVKYTYWTARPSMLDPSIKLAMPDPIFPSYPSGHSTISAAAAQVLGVMAPSHKGEWYEMAETARDSRLSAGVHYEIDNTAGFELGELVGRQIVQSLKLKAVL